MNKERVNDNNDNDFYENNDGRRIVCWDNDANDSDDDNFKSKGKRGKKEVGKNNNDHV